MSMTRQHHLAVARGIQATEMDDDTRKALCLNILEQITPVTSGLDRESFLALAFMPSDVADDIGE